MKIFVTLIFINYISHANATNYYFSTSSGDDSRTPAQAQNSATPWKTLAKLNSFFAILDGGDSILLKRGEIFYGNINISKSGLPHLPIVISAYGKGKLPIINGFATLTKWNLNKNGVYESIETLDDSLLNMVTLNDKEYAMGRYPNSEAPRKGWLSIFSSLNNSSITSASIISNQEWTGGELVIRKKNYVIDRNKIISQRGNTLNYAKGTAYLPTIGFGYFIQNHIATLDQFGEWFYDPVKKKLHVYFGESSPSSYKIQASKINTLISVRKQENIVFDNLSLEGSNLKGFDLYYSKNICIRNCRISFSGVDAIDGYKSENLLIENCTINDSNNNAFDLIGDCNESQIKNNVIKNTGLYAGMASNHGHSFTGINIDGDNNVVEYNEIDSSGYAGIRFEGNTVTIKNNYINTFCFIKDDGGGIYTGNSNAENERHSQIIEGNIILKGIGAKEGTTASTQQASGIYLDDNSSGINVIGNTVAFNNNAGILLHNCHKILVARNTSFSNGTQLLLLKDAAGKSLVRNNIITENIFFSEKASGFVASFLTNGNDINLFGKIDSNYYSRPLDSNIIIATSYIDNKIGRINKYYNLKDWKLQYKTDEHSKLSGNIKSYTIRSAQVLNKVANLNFNNAAEIKPIKCTIAWERSGLSDGAYMRISSLPGATLSYIIVPAGRIISGKNYVLNFNVKGDGERGKAIGIMLRKNDVPYTNLAQQTYRSMSSEMHQYEIMFTATKEEPNAVIIFSISDPNTTYWLNNIRLKEADATITKSEDHIIFEYNPTRSTKKIMLDGTYTDVKNKAYSGTIVLQPYSSAILMR